MTTEDIDPAAELEMPAEPGQVIEDEFATKPVSGNGPMQVIAVVSPKGGTGKTTLCGHLAVVAELVGAGPVALVDTDPQGSLAAWWESRGGDPEALVRSDEAMLVRDLERLRYASKRLVFIDTPSTMTELTRLAMRQADLALAPFRPSPHDLRAAAAMLESIVEERRALFFMVNGATVGARITGEVCAALGRYGAVSPVVVHHRHEYADSMIDGSTVMEAKRDGTATTEIVELWRQVAERLSRSEIRTERIAAAGVAKFVALAAATTTRGFGRRGVAATPPPAEKQSA